MVAQIALARDTPSYLLGVAVITQREAENPTRSKGQERVVASQGGHLKQLWTTPAFLSQGK